MTDGVIIAIIAAVTPGLGWCGKWVIDRFAAQDAEIELLKARLSAAAIDDKRSQPIMRRKTTGNREIVFANQAALEKIFAPIGVFDPVGRTLDELPWDPAALEALRQLDLQAPREPDGVAETIMVFSPDLDPHRVTKCIVESSDGQRFWEMRAWRTRAILRGARD